MAVPRLRVSGSPPGGLARESAVQVSDEVELYHRTYTTLLRSSGETRLRVLEPSHAAMNSSLHSLAQSLDEPDLGAFLYAMRRLPASIWHRSRSGSRPRFSARFSAASRASNISHRQAQRWAQLRRTSWPSAAR